MSQRTRSGSSKAAASATGIVKAMSGVEITPTPAPKPALEMPTMVTARIAEIQKRIE
jgi:hypothetical protein